MKALKKPPSTEKTNKNNPIAWELFFEGDDYFHSLQNDIKKAEKSIFVEKYIIQEDEIGIPFLELLMKKASEGVQVRLIIDGLGSYNITKSPVLEKLKASGVEVRIFRPVTWTFFFHFKNHRRDHRKLVVIDGKTVYIGGTNIKRTHSRRVMGDKCWRDTTIRISGNIAEQASIMFNRVWNFVNTNHLFMPVRSRRKRSILEGIEIIENISIVKRIRYRILFSRLIRNSKKNVFLQTAYFVPGIFLLRSLNRASRRGVKIKIILSEFSDVRAAKWAGRAVYSSLLKNGVQIFEYIPRFSHAKTMIVDDEYSIVGTTNLDYRSFLHNLEIDVVMHREDVAAELTKRFSADLAFSREIIYEEWKKRPLKDRILEKFFYIFRYYL
ncbi:MAG: phosphatidylserine/phosphatidylglycerophosphate/cardiolipin synthase family protein [Spirochaetia bacterium]|nr:phosphatidylserine/phosphatidylglycerophosphate/cardiolipin synthase family protein [Spirochaetia bacterium]